MAGFAVLQDTGETHMTEVVFTTITRGAPEPITWRARESPNYQSLFTEAMAGLSNSGRCNWIKRLGPGVNAVDQGLEVNRFLHLAIGRVSNESRTPPDVRCIGIMANHAQRGLVIAIAAMQAQEVMAVIALGDIHHLTPWRQGAADYKVPHHALDRHLVIKHGRGSKIGRHMALKTDPARARGAAGKRGGFGERVDTGGW